MTSTVSPKKTQKRSLQSPNLSKHEAKNTVEIEEVNLGS